MAAMTIFERLDRGRPTPVKKKTEQQPKETARLLLDWLDRRLGNTVTLNDLRNFAPRAVRDKATALRATQILAAHGHLAPLAAHKWEIIRKPLAPTDSQ